MKYPRIPEELDRRKKLTKKTLEDIKELFKSGCSKRYLAKKYKVSVATLCYHLNGEEYKRQWLEKAKQRKKRLMKLPEYREKHLEYSKLSHKYKRSCVPEENKYGVFNCKRWRHKSEREINRWREYNRVSRGKQKKLLPLAVMIK